MKGIHPLCHPEEQVPSRAVPPRGSALENVSTWYKREQRGGAVFPSAAVRCTQAGCGDTCLSFGWWREAGGSTIQSYPQLHSELELALATREPVSKLNKTQKSNNTENICEGWAWTQSHP